VDVFAEIYQLFTEIYLEGEINFCKGLLIFFFPVYN